MSTDPTLPAGRDQWLAAGSRQRTRVHRVATGHQTEMPGGRSIQPCVINHTDSDMMSTAAKVGVSASSMNHGTQRLTGPASAGAHHQGRPQPAMWGLRRKHRDSRSCWRSHPPAHPPACLEGTACSARLSSFQLQRCNVGAHDTEFIAPVMVPQDHRPGSRPTSANVEEQERGLRGVDEDGER